MLVFGAMLVSTHSRPKAAAFAWRKVQGSDPRFQHTAARRRLLFFSIKTKGAHLVSTHSRPKAAASPFTGFHPYMVVSTHSRPKAAAITNASKKY